MESDRVVASLSALAQPTRLAIFRLLVVCGAQGMAAGEIADALGLSPANLSFHFRTLSQAGLIASRQQGRFIYYAANFSAMNGMLAYLTENCCAGNADSCEVSINRCTTGDFQ